MRGLTLLYSQAYFTDLIWGENRKNWTPQNFLLYGNVVFLPENFFGEAFT